MTNLSPAAQAVLQAFDDRYEIGAFDENWQEECLAAALVAVADQVLIRPGIPSGEYSLLMRTIDNQVRAIAAELEGHQ